LTPATHLWALCRTAFRRCDRAELERLIHQLSELRPNCTLEQQLVMRARWLGWRAQRAATASNVNVNPAPVEQAQVFLAAAGENDVRDGGARLEALRVLALAGDWDRIDAHGRYKPLPPDTFENALGLGDLALSRARAALGQPAVDDDYGAMTVACVARAAPDSARAAAALGEAEHGYQEAARFAQEQDQRLETGWYGDTVHQRLALLELTTSRVRRGT
jgi:hypothetical protein